jgi:hypothetical protein
MARQTQWLLRLDLRNSFNLFHLVRMAWRSKALHLDCTFGSIITIENCIAMQSRIRQPFGSLQSELKYFNKFYLMLSKYG